MQKNLVWKLLSIAVMSLFLLIAINMISSLMSERKARRDEVISEIAESSSMAQQVTGPILVVPYLKSVKDPQYDAQGVITGYKARNVRGQLLFAPEIFVLDGTISTELRHRGIYQARLYHAKNSLNGEFRIPRDFGVDDNREDYRFEAPYLTIGISDVRGIERNLAVEIDGKDHGLIPGSRQAFLGSGVHVPLPDLNGEQAAQFHFHIDLPLQGTERLDIVPVGKDSRVSLNSDWPHPSFVGNFLPSSRSLSDEGFSAQWQTSYFATNLGELLEACARGKNRCSAINEQRLGVSFIDPVDQYAKSERSVKYGILFVMITFGGFFLFEVLKNLAVHPIQYGLVGLALALFFLLLVSLSEHLTFALAYALSASACVLLIGYYVCHVLGSLWRGIGFSLLLTSLYGMLYLLLLSEDYALLLGSGLLFGLLALTMLLTRKLDWYGISTRLDGSVKVAVYRPDASH